MQETSMGESNDPTLVDSGNLLNLRIPIFLLHLLLLFMYFFSLFLLVVSDATGFGVFIAVVPGEHFESKGGLVFRGSSKELEPRLRGRASVGEG